MSAQPDNKSVLLLGTRGIPPEHGGFETFVNRLAPYLLENGWDVSVYCQLEGGGPRYEDDYMGVRRINIPVKGKGVLATIVFDWISMKDALLRDGVILSF